MRISIFTIISAAIAAAATNAIDVQEIPGYEPIPEATTNKYSVIASSVLPTFSIDSLEPTYMPDEDLKPTGIQARSAAAPSQSPTATPVTDGPTDDSYEAFVKWMVSRGFEGYTEEDEKRHIARDVNPPTESPTANPTTDGPSDESFQTFVEWMEARHLEGTIEKAGVRNHARSVPSQAEPITDGPADDSFEAFVQWMQSRGISEGTEHHARSLYEQEENGYPLEGNHAIYARSAGANVYPEEQGDEHLDWSQVFHEELQLHARSLEADEHFENGEYEYFNGEPETPPVDRRSETDEDYPIEEEEENFEQFLARHGYNPEQYSTPTEPQEQAPHPDEAQLASSSSSATSTSTRVAAPAAAPTPKATSVGSPTPSPTSASQWSELASETAVSSSGNLQARSVSSHFRFRHHATSAYPSSGSSGGGDDVVGAISAATSSVSMSRRGFFHLPW